MPNSLVMSTGYKEGTLEATTYTMPVGPAPLPAAFTLTSAATGRKIEFSTNGGRTYSVETPDVTLTGSIMRASVVTVTHVRWTGNINDTWTIA